MRHLAVFFMVLLYVRPGFTADFEPLNDAQREHLPRAIAHQLRPGSVAGRVRPLQTLPPKPAVFELCVKEVARGLADPAPIAPAALADVFERLAELASRLGKEDAQRLRPHVEDEMVHLVQAVPGPSDARASLLRAYLTLGLSTHRLLDFFLGLDNQTALTEAGPALADLLRRGVGDDRHRIAIMLRTVGLSSLLDYTFLAQTGEMTEQELVQFFGHASVTFAHALADESVDDDDIKIAISSDRRRVMVRDQMEAFALALARGHKTVRSAFTKAVAAARGDREFGDRRLRFFKLFENRKLDWYDRSSWREAAETVGEAPRFRRYAAVPEKSRLEDFVGRGACNDNL